MPAEKNATRCVGRLGDSDDVQHQARFVGEHLQLDFRAPYEPPQSAVIVSSRAHPIRSSQQWVASGANAVGRNEDTETGALAVTA
jgi:hypothetical protein